jgi:hypothetical protein
MNFFYGAAQGLGVGYGAANIADVRQRETDLDEQVRGLQMHTERLSIACQALWEILQDKVGISHDELSAKMTEIDQREGPNGGKIKTHILQCPSCGRTVNSSRRTCLYCGAALPIDETEF